MQEFLLVSAITSWFMIILNLLISLALVRRVREGANANPYQPDILEVGTQAPDFSLETPNDTTISLTDYQNKENLMVFVSPTCIPFVNTCQSSKNCILAWQEMALTFC